MAESEKAFVVTTCAKRQASLHPARRAAAPAA